MPVEQTMDSMADDKSGRGHMRKICFILYFVLIEVVGIGCLCLAIFSMTNEPVAKLRIWDKFHETIPNLPPILCLIAAVLTIIVPPLGLLGVIKRNQIIIMSFMALVTMVAFLWFGIGAWCVSMHKLIIDDIVIIFDRLKRDGAAPQSEAFRELEDLQEFMPRLSSELDFLCCPSTPPSALTACATECGTRYRNFFSTIIFPAIYSTFFGAGGLCMLSLLCACLVSCHLDDVNPAF